MKLFLIRHGETVDNVAQLYAGIKDSALTVQGVLQAERLGQHLASQGIRFTTAFSSDLQRAAKTAQALLVEQAKNDGPGIIVHQLPTLREQDFGFYEGKLLNARQRDSKKSGKENHRSQHQDDPGFQDVESKESMTKRTDTFVAEHIRPLILQEPPEQNTVVAIVSHGIILSHLWRSILGIFARQTVALAPGLSVGGGGSTPLEYLGGWSNTGYLELDVVNVPTADVEATAGHVGSQPAAQSQAGNETGGECSKPSLPTAKMFIRTVNGKEHLRGLKRARGVGSSQFDEGQRKIESFFQKSKVG